jgi:hypothetical protein
MVDFTGAFLLVIIGITVMAFFALAGLVAVSIFI